MRRKVTYRPSKAQSILGGVVGVIFVCIGLFVVIPSTGPFGLLWTGMAVAITVMNFYHAFGKGYVGPEIEISDEVEPGQTAFQSDAPDHQHITPSGLDPKARLEQLETLREAGLLTREEYEEKRGEILRQL